MVVTCIISCAGSPKNIPVLKICINSLIAAQTASVSTRIIVTTNNAHHCIKKTNQIEKIIVSRKNAGFVGINNKAVAETLPQKSSHYLIINDDAWVDRNFFRELYNQQRQYPEGDVFIPYTTEGNTKRLDSFGVEYFKTGYSKNAFSKNITTSLASMSCLIITKPFIKKMIRSYGHFLNPILKWYLDDVDFSIRALALGGSFIKCRLMVAHHLRTFTWGRKSYLVMYQSFRNLLWIIIMTWPKTVIKKNFFRVCCWQLVTCGYCFIKYSPLMYPKILFDTMRHLKQLTTMRKHILGQYRHGEIFNQIFSSFEVRHQRLTF